MSTRSLTRTASLAVAAAVLAACDPGATAPHAPLPHVTPRPGALVTLEWQAEARALVAAGRLNALAGGRVYAALGVAQRRAVLRADAAGPLDPQLAAHAPPMDDPVDDPGGRRLAEMRRGAVAGASAQVLRHFFPSAAGALEARVAAQGADGPGGLHPHFARGVARGRAAGDELVAHVQGDGFTTPWTGTVPTGPGRWIPSALPPGGATLGAVTPYYLGSGSQFRPPPPPALDSPAFAADLGEVRDLTRDVTPEQLAFARGWDLPVGTPTPIGYWNDLAADYVAAHELDERAATEVFALMHAATFDALIGCWEAKYHYWTLRPSHADPTIALAFTLPNFPSYPSGHSCASASAGRVLEHFFPGRAAEVAAAVHDAGLSRILAGIHYRFDVTAGQALGRAVAEWAIAQAAAEPGA